MRLNVGDLVIYTGYSGVINKGDVVRVTGWHIDSSGAYYYSAETLDGMSVGQTKALKPIEKASAFNFIGGPLNDKELQLVNFALRHGWKISKEDGKWILE